MYIALNDKPPAVAVEYDRDGQRVLKQFADPYKARSFYASKLKAGKNPTVRKGA